MSTLCASLLFVYSILSFTSTRTCARIYSLMDIPQALSVLGMLPSGRVLKKLRKTWKLRCERMRRHQRSTPRTSCRHTETQVTFHYIFLPHILRYHHLGFHRTVKQQVWNLNSLAWITVSKCMVFSKIPQQIFKNVQQWAVQINLMCLLSGEVVSNEWF